MSYALDNTYPATSTKDNLWPLDKCHQIKRCSCLSTTVRTSDIHFLCLFCFLFFSLSLFYVCMAVNSRVKFMFYTDFLLKITHQTKKRAHAPSLVHTHIYDNFMHKISFCSQQTNQFCTVCLSIVSMGQECVCVCVYGKLYMFAKPNYLNPLISLSRTHKHALLYIYTNLCTHFYREG